MQEKSDILSHVRAVVQRVARAEVLVDGQVVGRCEVGLLALVGAHRNDTDDQAKKLADRIRGLRIFNDGDGKMNLALCDVGGSVLAVSNFTVYGDGAKNRRPSFMEAATYDEGERLFGVFVDELRRLGVSVETGIFGAHMEVRLVNDGPVTLIVDAG